MKVEIADRRSSRIPGQRNGQKLRQHRVIVAGAALIAVIVTTLVLADLVFPTGIRNSVRRVAINAGYGYLGSDIRLRSALAKLPGRLFSNLTSRPDIPRLVIDISFKNLAKLYAKRTEALDIGYLVQAEDDFVPASIRLQDRTVEVKLRLKGDMVDHVRTSKWSFRIHTKGDDQVFGLRRFSVQHPETRGFQAETLFLETLRRLDVLAPRYFFVDVVVNGTDIGLMALEEHFSKELLESAGRRDGVLLRFDESLMWADRVARGPEAVRYTGPFDSIYNAPIEPFRSSGVMKSERLQREYAVAAGLLRAFIEGDIPAAQVFDADKLGRFLAAAELWGVWHALGWNNQRFYFNPLTMRLEPIGYDADFDGEIGSGSINSSGSLTHRMLQDPEVYTAFEHYVRQLKSEVESGELMRFLEQIQANTLRELRTEFILLEEIRLSDLRARARELPYPASASDPPRPFGAYIIADTVQQDDGHYLELSNPLSENVEVVGIEWVMPDGVTVPFEPLESIDYPIGLQPRVEGHKRTAMVIEYRPLPDEDDAWLQVRSRLRGYTDLKLARVRPGAFPLTTNPRPVGDLDAALAKNPFMSVSADGEAVRVAKGRWTVSGSLVIPRGIELRIPAGTTLLFEPGASLVTYGPTRFLGTDRDAVILDVNSGQPGAVWQGIVVYEADKRSVWEHVAVGHTGGVRWSAWELTGGVTFYRSDVTMTNCRFKGNLAEDAVNIIHSDFELQDVEFIETASDGLDSDFSTGSIRGGSFSVIGSGGGADGVDFSGSTVTIHGTQFTRVTDKAISVGEKSTVTASDVDIEQCAVGAASKDGSLLRIRNATIREASIAGLMSYKKKPEYGGASLVAENILISESTRPTWVEHGNDLRFDGKTLAAEDMDVDALYRSSMQRGGRR